MNAPTVRRNMAGVSSTKCGGAMVEARKPKRQLMVTEGVAGAIV
jgi:hypothetical protein